MAPHLARHGNMLFLKTDGMRLQRLKVTHVTAAVSFSFGDRAIILTGRSESQSRYNDVWEFLPDGVQEIEK